MHQNCPYGYFSSVVIKTYNNLDNLMLIFMIHLGFCKKAVTCSQQFDKNEHLKLIAGTSWPLYNLEIIQ